MIKMFWGRGRRYWFYLTGMPGWARMSSNYPVGFRGNPYPFCRFFPWLPRGWWTGAFGPIEMTPQGPVLTGSSVSDQVKQGWFGFPQQSNMPKEQEIAMLENQLKMIEDEKKVIEQTINSIKERIKQLKG